MVLEWTPEDASLRISLHLKRSMGDSEPPDIFQHHQGTGDLGVIHTNLQLHVHYYSAI